MIYVYVATYVHCITFNATVIVCAADYVVFQYRAIVQ